ncbi:MAG: hypothetical protein O2954_07985 [bacterium]|nr:hypothetical protein [bacterium]
MNGSTLLSLEEIPGSAPNQIQALVRFTGAGNVQGYHVAIRYDEAVLELIDATAAGNWISGAGEFLRLRFRVIDPMVAGRVEIVNAFVSDPAGSFRRRDGCCC